MSSRLQDIISQCDELLSEIKFTSHSDEISRLELIINKQKEQIQKLETTLAQCQTKISSMIKQQRRISDDEYFKQFKPETFTDIKYNYDRTQLSYTFNIIILAIKTDSNTNYYSSITHYLSDTGYLIKYSKIDPQRCGDSQRSVELINIPFLVEYGISERKIEFEIMKQCRDGGYIDAKIGYKNMNTDRINLSGDIMDRIKSFYFFNKI
jgi:hypothetical protein